MIRRTTYSDVIGRRKQYLKKYKTMELINGLKEEVQKQI